MRVLGVPGEHPRPARGLTLTCHGLPTSLSWPLPGGYTVTHTITRLGMPVWFPYYALLGARIPDAIITFCAWGVSWLRWGARESLCHTTDSVSGLVLLCYFIHPPMLPSFFLFPSGARLLSRTDRDPPRARSSTCYTTAFWKHGRSPRRRPFAERWTVPSIANVGRRPLRRRTSETRRGRVGRRHWRGRDQEAPVRKPPRILPDQYPRTL